MKAVESHVTESSYRFDLSNKEGLNLRKLILKFLGHDENFGGTVSIADSTCRMFLSEKPYSILLSETTSK